MPAGRVSSWKTAGRFRGGACWESALFREEQRLKPGTAQLRQSVPEAALTSLRSSVKFLYIEVNL